MPEAVRYSAMLQIRECFSYAFLWLFYRTCIVSRPDSTDHRITSKRPKHKPSKSDAYRIRDYLYTHNVQLGATYKAGTQSTEAYNTALKACADYINAEPDEVGMSSFFLSFSFQYLMSLPI